MSDMNYGICNKCGFTPMDCTCYTDNMEKAVAEKDERIAELEEALEFYADKKSYRFRVLVTANSDYFPTVLQDNGQRARQALTKGNDK